MNIGGLVYADGGQDDYDHEAGSRSIGGGFHAGFNVVSS